jgi:hypothetical protein
VSFHLEDGCAWLYSRCSGQPGRQLLPHNHVYVCRACVHAHCVLMHTCMIAFSPGRTQVGLCTQCWASCAETAANRALANSTIRKADVFMLTVLTSTNAGSEPWQAVTRWRRECRTGKRHDRTAEHGHALMILIMESVHGTCIRVSVVISGITAVGYCQ